MPVQHPRDGAHVADHPGDVGGRRERAQLHRPPGELEQPALEIREVDLPLVGEADLHHLGDRLQPGQLVGVVLVGADEDHRPLVAGNGARELVLALQRLGDAPAQQAHQLVDRRGGAGPDEEHLVLRAGVHRAADHPARLLAQLGHHPPGGGDGGVRVRVERSHPPQPGLDEVQVAPGGRQIGVGHQPPPVGAVQAGAPAHLVLANEGRDFLEGLHGWRITHAGRDPAIGRATRCVTTGSTWRLHGPSAHGR